MKIVHINTCNYGSTGGIIRMLIQRTVQLGSDSRISYPDSRLNAKLRTNSDFVIGNRLARFLHLKLAYFTGYHGCFSYFSTYMFLVRLRIFKPDIIHIHNLHNAYINFNLLFNFIKKHDISIVWTLHDCWAFTGHCPHYTMVNCFKWQSKCFDCPQYKEYPATRIDRSEQMYFYKRDLFTGVKSMILVTPSNWLSQMVGMSFLKDYKRFVVYNGIDSNVYKPTASDFRKANGLEGKTIVLGVASLWSNRKGLNVFIELSQILDNNFAIVLVGNMANHADDLPDCIYSIPVIDTEQLVRIYSAADWFLNPSVEETMGLVTVEALACGTPVLVSDSTAVPEVVDLSCGLVILSNNSIDYKTALESPFTASQDDCIRCARKYNLDAMLNSYMSLYKALI